MLGPLLVRRAGTVLPVPAGRQRALLAALLVDANHVVPVAALTEALWGDSPPPSERVSLHNYVKRLRQSLGDAAHSRISTHPGGYLIRVGPGELDVSRFEALLAGAREAARAGCWDRAAERLDSALSLWRGEPLADVFSEVLTLREVPRLAELRQQALEARIDADLHRGRHAETISELRRLAAEHPLRERVHALLMLALYRDGRQAEALDAYQHARRVLVDELGVEPGAELRQLHLRILSARASGSARPPGRQPGHHAARIDASERAPVPLLPAQLPADVADFTGREGVVADLCGRLGSAAEDGPPGAVVVSAVAGQGGIGKTAVALHAAHRVVGRFTDGCLYANLQGASRPLAPGVVLARFLRDLGVDGSAIPAGEAERAAAYRSRLAGRRMLIVLDDAHDSAQVRPLLPGRAGCAALVTSRNWLADLDGATVLELDVLPQPEARALFSRVVGEQRAAAEPEGVEAVLDACAGLPLAIRIAAARLVSRPAWRISSLAERLADERRRLDELALGDHAVRASFQVSYAALPSGSGAGRGSDPARAFRLLGLWPGKDLGLLAAAALLGRSRDHARRELEVLVDAHLLGSPAEGRYRFHDLLRVFAAERAREQEPGAASSEAMSRLLTWYLQAAAAAVRVIAPPRMLPVFGRPAPAMELPAFAGYWPAMQWCDDELANIVTATAEAAGRGLDDIAWKLPVTTWGYFHLRQHWAEWIATHRCALDSARRLGDRHAEAWVLNNLGIAFAQQLRSDEAIGYLRQALAMRREIGDRHGEAYSLNNLAGVLTYLHRYPESAACHEQALPIRREVGDKAGEAMTLGNLGSLYCEMRAFEDAIVHLERALEISRDIGDRHAEANQLDDLAGIFIDLDRFDDATRCNTQALRIHADMGNRYGVAESLSKLGHTLRRLGRDDDARRFWEQALAIYRQLGIPKAYLLQASLDQLSRDGGCRPAGSPPAAGQDHEVVNAIMRAADCVPEYGTRNRVLDDKPPDDARSAGWATSIR
jgi:DNA-binding SARP family transcriptional activator